MFGIAVVLEKDLAGSLRRVDAHAVCQRSGERSGGARCGERGEACAPFVMMALVDSFCLNCDASVRAGVRLAAGSRAVWAPG